MVQTLQTIPGEVWQTSGSSEHMGGARATQHLLRICELQAGQRVLDIGCGTGYTLYLLAQEFGTQAVGVDLNLQFLRAARLRAAVSDHAELICPLNADAGRLPFPSGVFDCAILESILVHSDAGRLLAEAYRVLAPGGRLGVNEMTYIMPPPQQLVELLEKQLRIKAHKPEGWEEIFEKAGFRTVTTESRPFSMWEQLKNHLREEGVVGYLSALRKGLASKRLRNAFLNREMLSAMRRFSKAVGYGLYVVEKPLV